MVRALSHDGMSLTCSLPSRFESYHLYSIYFSYLARVSVSWLQYLASHASTSPECGSVVGLFQMAGANWLTGTRALLHLLPGLWLLFMLGLLPQLHLLSLPDLSDLLMR